MHSPINDYNFVATSNHATCSINRYAFYFVSQPIHHDTVALSHATESCMGIVAFRIVLQNKVSYYLSAITSYREMMVVYYVTSYRETMVVCYLTS